MSNPHHPEFDRATPVATPPALAALCNGDSAQAAACREERAAHRVAFLAGLSALALWGVLLFTLATRLQPPSVF